jgi:hypothetical protein
VTLAQKELLIISSQKEISYPKSDLVGGKYGVIRKLISSTFFWYSMKHKKLVCMAIIIIRKNNK